VNRPPTASRAINARLANCPLLLRFVPAYQGGLRVVVGVGALGAFERADRPGMGKIEGLAREQVGDGENTK